MIMKWKTIFHSGLDNCLPCDTLRGVEFLGSCFILRCVWVRLRRSEVPTHGVTEGFVRFTFTRHNLSKSEILVKRIFFAVAAFVCQMNALIFCPSSHYACCPLTFTSNYEPFHCEETFAAFGMLLRLCSGVCTF